MCGPCPPRSLLGHIPRTGPRNLAGKMDISSCRSTLQEQSRRSRLLSYHIYFVSRKCPVMYFETATLATASWIFCCAKFLVYLSTSPLHYTCRLRYVSEQKICHGSATRISRQSPGLARENPGMKMVSDSQKRNARRKVIGRFKSTELAWWVCTLLPRFWHLASHACTYVSIRVEIKPRIHEGPA